MVAIYTRLLKKEETESQVVLSLYQRKKQQKKKVSKLGVANMHSGRDGCYFSV